MYDTARRVALVRQRVRKNTRRRQQHGIYGLSAACMLLFAVLMQAISTVVRPGQTVAWGVFGAMLLREDAGGYVLVAVVSFAAAAAITALCMRFRIREKTGKRAGQASRARRNRREKRHEETNTQHSASMLYDADHDARDGLRGGWRGCRTRVGNRRPV